MADCHRVLRVASKLAASVARVLHAHVQPLNWDQKEYWSVACGHVRNLASADGEVCLEGGGTEGKGGVQDGSILRRDGGGHRVRRLIYAPPVEVECPGGGLGITPH